MSKLSKKQREIILYIFFGVVTTVINWGLYALFANALNLSVALSNILSWIITIAIAFITNKLFVFESKSFKASVLLKESISFLGSRAITGVIELVGVPLLEMTGFDSLFYPILEGLGFKWDIFFTPGIYSKISLAVIIVILNYIFSKLFVFKNKQGKAE